MWSIQGDEEVKKSDYQELKDQFLNRYGGVCACCGEFNPKFLTLDHVKNNGVDKRTLTVWERPPRFKTPMPRASYRPTEYFLRDAVKNYQPEEYQILCYNCNCARAHNDGICPHEQESGDAKAYRWRGSK